MKITPTLLMGLILTTSPLQAFDSSSDGSNSENSRLGATTTSYHSFTNAELRIPINGSSEDLGFEDVSATSTTAYDKGSPFISLVSNYRPAEVLEKNIDYYILQPILYAGGSTTLVGGLIVLFGDYSYYNTGILTTGIGLGITAGSLGLKSIVRLGAGAIEWYRHCRRQAKNENSCC